MGLDETTDPDSLSARLAVEAIRAHDRFKAKLKAGGSRRVEDHLEGLASPSRARDRGRSSSLHF